MGKKKDSIHSHQSNRSLALSETLQVRALIKFPPASSCGPTSAQRKGLRANGLWVASSVPPLGLPPEPRRAPGATPAEVTVTTILGASVTAGEHQKPGDLLTEPLGGRRLSFTKGLSRTSSKIKRKSGALKIILSISAIH